MFPILISLMIFSCLGLGETTQSFYNMEECRFYEEAENKFQCGANGFLANNGLKYCNMTFSGDFYNSLDDEEKKLHECVAKCLINRMRIFLEENPDVMCDEISAKGLDSHPDCHVDCGICIDCRRKKNTLFKLYDFIDVVSNMRITIKILRGCGGLLSGAWKCFVSSGTNEEAPLTNSEQFVVTKLNLTSIKSERHSKNLTSLRDEKSVQSYGFSIVSFSIFLPILLLFPSELLTYFA